MDVITQWLSIGANYYHLPSGKAWELYAQEGLSIEKLLRSVANTQQLSLPSPAARNCIGVQAYGDVTQLPKFMWGVPGYGVQD